MGKRRCQPETGVIVGVLAVLAIASAGPAVAQRATLPEFVDERRLPPSDAEVRKQAEEERRRAAETESRQKAEMEARQKAEAEAKRQADEERRRAVEAEARQKAEAEAKQRAELEAKQRAELEAKRQAEEDRRRAAEAEAKRQAEEEDRRRTAAAPAAVPRLAQSPSNCAPDQISARAIAGGRVQIDVDAPCRAGLSVTLRYGAFEFPQALDGSGRGQVILDLFQGKSMPVSLQLGDGPRQPVSLDAVDLSGISKVAVVWRAPVNLDLHVYEYAARHGEAGHVWASAPGSVDAAEAEMRKSRRGRGFLSTVSNIAGAGDKAEVYTFIHSSEQQSGIIATALDYESRGSTPSGPNCGSGPQASVVYDTFVLTGGGQVSRERGAIAAVTCGTHLTGAGRYMEDAIPDLTARP